MLVSSKKIEKMLRDRDRLERMAKIEYQEAKDLFSVGNMEFTIELQLANQHLGASREITRTLKNIGYEECKRMSEKEKQLLIAGIKQKLCGIGVIYLEDLDRRRKDGWTQVKTPDFENGVMKRVSKQLQNGHFTQRYKRYNGIKLNV